MQRLRIKPPEPQFRVKTRVGSHRLDFAWEEEKLALEFDGKTKYFDYKPTDEVIFEERRREKALMEDGWRFIRIEWKDLFQEGTFKERILRALRSRR
jgi:very-short-patch-repair endonuclease